MMDENFEFFRAEALKKYQIQNKQDNLLDVELPHYRSIKKLWIALVIIFVIGFSLCFIPIPSYAYGMVIVLEDPVENKFSMENPVAVFLHAQYDGEIQAEQKIILQLPGENLKRQAIFVEDNLLSPEDIQSQYSVEVDQYENFPQPAVVIVTDLEPNQDLLRANSYVRGGVYSARVGVGSRRLYWLLWELI